MENADALLKEVKDIFPDLKYTLSDIKYPTYEIIIDFSTRVLKELCIDTNIIFQPPELQHLQYAEIYKETLPLFKLFFTFQHLLPEHMCDYSVALFFEKRNAQGFQWLQTIINFMQFLRWRLKETNLLGFAVELEEWLKEVQMKRQKCDEMQEELNQRAMHRSSRETYITELDQSIGSLKATIAENLVQRDKYSAETNHRTAQKQQLEDKAEKLIIKFNQANDQYKTLQGQVVSSPEKLITELADAQRHFSDLNNQLEHVKQRRMANKNHIRTLEQFHVELESRTVRCAELVSQAKSLEALDKQLESVIQSTDCQTQASTNMKPQLSLAMKKSMRLSEELAALKLHISQDEAALQKQSRDENLHFKQEVDERNHSIRQLSELETACAEKKGAITANTNDIKETYLDLEETHKNFIENRDQNLGALFSHVKEHLSKKRDDAEL